MKQLNELAPTMLSALEAAQKALINYQHEPNRYGMLEQVNAIVNEPSLVEAMKVIRTAQKVDETVLEKYWPESSQINKTTYIPTHSVLDVEFKSNSKTYHYYNFPHSKWIELLHCPSIGSFINKEVKGKHEYKLQDNKEVSPIQIGGL